MMQRIRCLQAHLRQRRRAAQANAEWQSQESCHTATTAGCGGRGTPWSKTRRCGRRSKTLRRHRPGPSPPAPAPTPARPPAHRPTWRPGQAGHRLRHGVSRQPAVRRSGRAQRDLVNGGPTPSGSRSTWAPIPHRPGGPADHADARRLHRTPRVVGDAGRARWSLLHEFSRSHRRQPDPGGALSPPYPSVRYIRIETLDSPSWVAWREIEAFRPPL